jgi:hypothetical protein
MPPPVPEEPENVADKVRVKRICQTARQPNGARKLVDEPDEPNNYGPRDR